MKSSLSSWAKVAGRTSAHLQDMFDRAADWGFRKMKEASKVKEKAEKKGGRAAKTAKSVARGTMRFVGTMGEEFYGTYNDLKRKRGKKK